MKPQRPTGSTHLLNGKVEQTSGPFSCVVRLTTGQLLTLPLPARVGDDVVGSFGIYTPPADPTPIRGTRGAPSVPGPPKAAA